MVARILNKQCKMRTYEIVTLIKSIQSTFYSIYLYNWIKVYYVFNNDKLINIFQRCAN